MTQKELLYIEDVYNHENLVMDVINKSIEEVSDEKYASILSEHLETHESLSKKLTKLLESEAK